MVKLVLTLMALVLSAEPLHAGIITNYLKNYRFGLGLGVSQNTPSLSYSHPVAAEIAPGCLPDISDPSRMNCTIDISDVNSQPLYFTMQQVFRRQGLWHFNSDIGFSSYILEGKIIKAETAAASLSPVSQPIQHGRMHLYGMKAKGYIEFGITPQKRWPDLLMSLGLGKQFVFGNMMVETVRRNIQVESSLIHLKTELVWMRFGEGFLSTYVSMDASHSEVPVYRGKIGEASKFIVSPSSYEMGLLHLLFPFRLR
jgi:hypothetical protein